MRVHEITPYLYISSWPDVKTVSSLRFDTIVTVCKKPLPPDIKALVRNAIHIPLSDGKQLPDGLEDVVDIVVESCQMNQKTLLHCYLGRNRSFLAGTYAYANLTGISPKEAFEHMRSIYPKCLYNQNFIEFLNQ